MNKNGKPITANTENPYKKTEFEAFLELIKEKSTAHWQQIAETLGVDKNTITRWKQHPLAQKAIRDGIERAFEEMERSGKDDWRMWETKLKMLGISPIEKSESKEEIEVKGEWRPIDYREAAKLIAEAKKKDNGK